MMKDSSNLKSIDDIKADGEFFWDQPIYQKNFTFAIYEDQYRRMAEYFVSKYGVGLPLKEESFRL
jgi:hypothetical protein